MARHWRARDVVLHWPRRTRRLVTVGGKERTEAEWTVILAASGFELVSITPPTQLGAVSAIEVQLVGV